MRLSLQNRMDWRTFGASINKLALTLKDNDNDKINEQTKYNDTNRTNGTFGFAQRTKVHNANSGV